MTTDEAILENRKSSQYWLDDPDFAAYYAGFFDGEGCICASGEAFEVTITNTNLQVLARLVMEFGGHIVKQRPATERRKAVYVWYAGNKDTVERFLQLIEPYLIVKKRQAELAIEYCQPWRSRKEKKAFKKEITRLKHMSENWRIELTSNGEKVILFEVRNGQITVKPNV